MFKRLAFLLLLPLEIFCQKTPETDITRISAAVFASSEVMMHDVVNPPAASRFYTYMMLGAYAIVAQNDSTLPGLPKLIKGEPNIVVTANSRYNYKIAAVYCMLETGRLMLPSGYMLKKNIDEFVVSFQKQKIDTALFSSSISVGATVARQIVAFAKADHYGQLSAKLRYTPMKGDAYWYPTPPAYIEAVEPNWKTIRPMFLDSSNEFVPKPPVAFSKDSSSSFYRIAKEVHDVAVNLSTEQFAQAAFWDCNPFAVSTSGHMSIGFKKISPGGHWMNIGGIASKKAKLDFNKTILLYTMLGAAIMDGFICCWDEKYRSNRVRPETYINRMMDVRWQPLLQTPPFPEYPSGHSVISAAAAEVLTFLLGDNFSYVDDSELMFELPARSFNSFRQASNEAAISRLYGGIHFRDAVEEGQVQGIAVGKKAIAKMQAAGIKTFISVRK